MRAERSLKFRSILAQVREQGADATLLYIFARSINFEFEKRLGIMCPKSRYFLDPREWIARALTILTSSDQLLRITALLFSL